MKNANWNKGKNNIWAPVLCALVALLLCTFIVPSNGVAYADEADWESKYNDFIASLDANDAGEWYFDQANLDIYGALCALENILNDTRFDKELLKADPIVIAVIDSGIGYAYTTDGTLEYGVSSENVYDEGVQYKLHPIFDDVLLKDANGNYVYKNVASEVNIKYNTNVINTITAVESGNIAQDLVDNTSNDHGTHVTGIVAMLIHKLGLEDYIKILPIKANVSLEKEVKNGKTNYYAGYQIDTLEEAMDFCLENGVDIVNMSFTAYKNGLLGSIDEGYKFADYSDDMLIVASAGNKGDNIMGYPACASNVLGVMNYCLDGDGNAKLADSSNYGDWYDVAAPGTGIISSINGDEYGKLSGTSMATPITSVGAALAYFRYRGYVNYNIEPTPAIVHKMMRYSIGDNSDENACAMLSFSNTFSYDFHLDKFFLAEIGMSPELKRVQISADVKSEYMIYEVDSVTFTATPDPIEYVQYDDGVVWYCYIDGYIPIQLDHGWSAELHLEELGSYKVWATYVIDNVIHKTNEISFVVKGHDPSVLSIYTPRVNEYLVGEEYVLTVPIDYICGTYGSKDVTWYINDEKLDGYTDSSMVFAPEKVGKYTIKATVDGKQIGDVVTIYVTGKTAELMREELEVIVEELSELLTNVVKNITAVRVIVGVVGLIVCYICLCVKRKKKGTIDSANDQENIEGLFDNDNELRK